MTDTNPDHQPLDKDFKKQQFNGVGGGVGNGVDAASHILSYQTAAPAKTILITNNYSQNGTSNVSGPNISNSGTNSITILTSHPNHPVAAVDPGKTVVLDRINICINNHYDSGQGMSIKKEPAVKIKQEKPEITYTAGQDVLVQEKDGRFFLGTVIVVDACRCLVRFDDNTEKWAEVSKLKKFGTNKTVDSGPLCVVCKKTQNAEVVETCERCGRGYHRRCTQGNFGVNGVWHCRRCLAQNGLKMAPECSKTSLQGKTDSKINSRIFTDKSQLSYNVSH